MKFFFSGAVTSSPVKRRLRSGAPPGPDVSLLSPDSSYVCLPAAAGGAACCCRRSPRLLTNGYYHVSEESFCRDQEGNVSLTPCTTNVSYKENPVRVFRRRRRPRASLAALLSEVTETCQSWFDQRVLRGVFGRSQDRDRDLDLDQDQDLAWNLDQDRTWDQDREWDQTQDQDWGRTRDRDQDRDQDQDWDQEAERSLTRLDHEACGFVYDPAEAPPPLDKLSRLLEAEASPAPKVLIQEDICSEICQSKQSFLRSPPGLSEVPPPLLFCHGVPPPPRRPGPAPQTVLLLLLFTFVLSALFSRCLPWSLAAAASVLLLLPASMVLSRWGPPGQWRKAKTEDITSRNE